MTSHFVSFSAEVNPTTTENLIAVLSQLCNQQATEVHLMLSTPGGSVMHGFTLYNVLRALPITLITYNMGNVDSIGNVVFLAGCKRYACPSSTFMFHGAGFDVPSAMRLVDRNLREYLDSIGSDHRRIGAVMGQHTSLLEEDVMELFKETRTKDVGWAHQVGIINAIREPHIPAGTPIHSLVFNR